MVRVWRKRMVRMVRVWRMRMVWMMGVWRMWMMRVVIVRLWLWLGRGAMTMRRRKLPVDTDRSDAELQHAAATGLSSRAAAFVPSEGASNFPGQQEETACVFVDTVERAGGGLRNFLCVWYSSRRRWDSVCVV